MARKTSHAAWLAGVSGAVFPFLLVAAWTAGLIGLSVSILIIRLAREDRWLACVIFLSAFAVACLVPSVLHEGWARLPRVLGQPLIFGFVAAVIAGSWFAPSIAARRKP